MLRDLNLVINRYRAKYYALNNSLKDVILALVFIILRCTFLLLV